MYSLIFFATGNSAFSVVRRFEGKRPGDAPGQGQQVWAALRETFDGCSREEFRAEHQNMSHAKMTPSQDPDKFLYKMDSCRKRLMRAHRRSPTGRQYEDILLRRVNTAGVPHRPTVRGDSSATRAHRRRAANGQEHSSAHLAAGVPEAFVWPISRDGTSACRRSANHGGHLCQQSLPFKHHLIRHRRTRRRNAGDKLRSQRCLVPSPFQVWPLLEQAPQPSQTAAAGRTTSTTIAQQKSAHERTAAEEKWRRRRGHLVFIPRKHHPT